jgi:hypothetical protein
MIQPLMPVLDSEFIEVENVPCEFLLSVLDAKSEQGWAIDARLYRQVSVSIHVCNPAWPLRLPDHYSRTAFVLKNTGNAICTCSYAMVEAQKQEQIQRARLWHRGFVGSGVVLGLALGYIGFRHLR